MNLSTRRMDRWERRVPGNPRILFPIPLFKPDIYTTSGIEDPYELEDSPLSSRLSYHHHDNHRRLRKGSGTQRDKGQLKERPQSAASQAPRGLGWRRKVFLGLT